MSKLSNYLETALLNAALRAVAYQSPATVYVALYTSDPTDTDTGTEVSGGSYARQAVTFEAPTDGVAANTGAVVFATASAPWGVITHVGIRDAAAAGNLLWYGALASSKDVANGDRFEIAAGALSCSLA